jgi:hypothetical protein
VGWAEFAKGWGVGGIQKIRMGLDSRLPLSFEPRTKGVEPVHRHPPPRKPDTESPQRNLLDPSSTETEPSAAKDVYAQNHAQTTNRQGEFHPQPLTEPCVTVSRHTALRSRRQIV